MLESAHFFEIFFPGVWRDEIFDFHLGAFTVAENKIAWADFVSEGFALLSETKRNVGVDGIDNIFIISENALGGLGAEVGKVFTRCFGIVIRKYGANVSGKHHIKLTNRAPVLFAADWAFGMSI